MSKIDRDGECTVIFAVSGFRSLDTPKQGFLGLASDFVDALERAYRHISRYPASGSSRYAVELSLPGLRAWPLSQVPHIVFYRETADCIDVWRVLHGARDIPAWMRETTPE